MSLTRFIGEGNIAEEDRCISHKKYVDVYLLRLARHCSRCKYIYKYFLLSECRKCYSLIQIKAQPNLFGHLRPLPEASFTKNKSPTAIFPSTIW